MCLESKKTITEYSKVIVSTCGARFCQSPNLEHSCRTAGFSLCLQRWMTGYFPLSLSWCARSGLWQLHWPCFDSLRWPGSWLWIVDFGHPMCAPRGSKNVEILLQSCSSIVLCFCTGKSCYWSSLDWFSSIMMSWQFRAQAQQSLLITVDSCIRASIQMVQCHRGTYSYSPGHGLFIYEFRWVI
jgi:hypothetical protein